ncbi:TPA: hypothetical protein ACS78A_001488 [Providencia alcalifaciens]
MIYQTGTIKTTAGQTKITGTGTRWKDNLAGISEGCPISIFINNAVHMNTVLSVNSDTEINLTYPVSVTASAAKYQIATFVLDSMSDGVRKMLANQQYIQYFLRNMDTWMTQDGIVEIKTPTGETVKLESIIALKKLIDRKFDKDGGKVTNSLTTGGNILCDGGVIQSSSTISESRIQLDATISDTARINSQRKGKGWRNHVLPDSSGTLMQVGDHGWGGIGESVVYDEIQMYGHMRSKSTVSKTFRNNITTSMAPPYGAIGYFKAIDTFTSISAAYDGSSVVVVGGNSVNAYAHILYTNRNTTKDANGNLKAASPIIKVFADHIELNDESEGIELEKLGTGRYKLKGTLGMNSDASWGGYNGGLVAPLGINGLELLWVDYKVLSDGDIIIETNYRKHSDLPPPVLLKRLITYPEFMDENGDELESYAPVDIPNGHWIDVRVNMPSDSIYNQKLLEAERLAKIEAERVAKEEAEKMAQEDDGTGI